MVGWKQEVQHGNKFLIYVPWTTNIDSTFGDFKATLDSEMKRLQRKGVGAEKKQAEPLSEEEEEQFGA